MEYKEIKNLMDDMGNSKLTEIEIEYPDGIKISMKKGMPVVQNVGSLAVQEHKLPIVQEEQEKAPAVIQKQEVCKKVEGNVIKSPMVGTFYSKPSPDAEAFVKVGSKVKKGDTLCIIEAMKLMNEIESEFDGEVVEILGKEENMVEYGQPLFIIK